jgi:hypothetical protein
MGASAKSLCRGPADRSRPRIVRKLLTNLWPCGLATLQAHHVDDPRPPYYAGGGGSPRR